MRRVIFLLPLFLSLSAKALAQVDVGTGVGADTFVPGEVVREPKLSIYPLALATSLAFDATTWSSIQVSTATPARELSELIRKGYYRLELFQMVLLAQESRTPLKLLVDQRDKGTSLRDLATQQHLDIDVVYDQAVALQGRVDGLMPKIMTVSISTPTPSGQPFPNKPPGERIPLPY